MTRIVYQSQFTVGQLIRHRRLNYRGVIIGVDEIFRGTDEWYEKMALSRPPRDRPWYHVLPDGTSHQTYVAERNMALDPEGGPIKHPYVDHFFDQFSNGIYSHSERLN